MTVPTLLNFNEANAYCMGIKDPIIRELTGLVFGALTQKWLKGERPTGAFDVLFFVKTLEESFASQEVIRGILRGESIMWPEPNNP
jgi:hypothetical protein